MTGNTMIRKYSILTDDQGRLNVHKMDVSWTPTPADKGSHIICATAEDNKWFVTIKINEF